MKAARSAWFEHFAGVRLDQLVLLGEFGATTAMRRTHGRAPPGERVVAAVPHGHWKVIGTTAAMTVGGIVASASFDGATDAELFVTFVREGLVPVLRPGRVVVMDNLAPHKVPEVARLIATADSRVLLLPPYSPDFNPIEQAFSTVKSYLRKLATRTVDGLFDGIGLALSSITSADAAAYIRNSGHVLR